MTSIDANSQVLFVDSNAPPGGDGATWNTALDDLSLALATATGGTDVWVAGGVYRPAPLAGSRTSTFGMKSGVRILGGFAGNETQESQRDPNQNPTTLSGDLNGDDGPGFSNVSENSIHVVDASDVDASAVLDGVIITGGNANDASALGGTRGGGLYSNQGSPTLRRVIFRFNRSDGPSSSTQPPGGGALGLDSANGAHIEECVFDANDATRGGGLFALGGTVDLLGCRFVANTALFGAGVQVQNAVFTATDCDFETGASVFGGAMHIADAPQSIVRLERSRFENNTTSANGGAVTAVGSGTKLTVVDCDFLGNTSGTEGGALWASSGPILIERSRFKNNAAFGPGAGACLSVVGTSILVSDSTFESSNGHHIWSLGNKASGDDVIFQRCTFLNPGNQIAIWSDHMALVQLDSCIVWGPHPSPLLGEHFVDYSVIKGGYPGTGNLSQNPMFVNESLGDLRLKATSPCIDAGRPSGPIAGIDHDDDPRYLDGDLDGIFRVDMGADELNTLHLEVSGAFTPGGTVSVDSTGAVWPASLLLVSAHPGDQFLNRHGALLIDTTGPFFALPWPSPPSQIPASIPTSLPMGITIYLQQVGSLGPTGTTSNRISLSH